MNLAAWVERNGRRLRDLPALAEGERIHATWVQYAERTAAVPWIRSVWIGSRASSGPRSTGSSTRCRPTITGRFSSENCVNSCPPRPAGLHVVLTSTFPAGLRFV